MAAYLSRLHHISLHVSHVNKLAHDLVSKFKFNLFAVRITDKARQLAFRKGSAIFLVNERSNEPKEKRNGHFCPPILSPSDLEVSCNQIKLREWRSDSQDVNKCLYDVQACYSVDSACNVCFEVEDVERSFASLRGQGCDILVPPTEVQDHRGLVTYSIVRSIVGNVCHTLIDRTKYDGNFLPGFYELETAGDDHLQNSQDEQCPVTHFDHVTYACPRGSTTEVMRWYEKNFSFKKFFIGSNDDAEEGFVLNENGIGLRLTAMEYRNRTETGIKLAFKDKNEPDCKFVIAESLPEQGRNQVDTFLEQHRGPGIQHVALYTENIVSTADIMTEAGVQFFTPPPAYYAVAGKQQEIKEAGHDPKKLRQLGILLDADLHMHEEYKSLANGRGHLLLGADRAEGGQWVWGGKYLCLMEVCSVVYGESGA
ncbi:4-hydroxyphenylpyruvate dioxygenase-like protein isoform X2 [Brachyhypopomus gauderio]|uniref:4-hydroxyphenylpyruvate dioxygenase-like protein isoform X2 n=1 Tax=Brachyhypopomus gauderio TaxID=698409 RepID=UPI0040428FB2